MGLVHTAITPHGEGIIPELNINMSSSFKKLKVAMEQMAKDLVDASPDVIVIASPHNVRIDDHVGIILTEHLKGTLQHEGNEIELDWKIDKEMGRVIYNRSKEEGIPVVGINFGALEGPHSVMQMDWGTFIPLWFLKKEFEKNELPLPPVTLVTPARKISWMHLINLGKQIRLAARDLDVNISFLASADQAHSHDPNGPYGHDPAAKEYDLKVLQIVKKHQLEKLLEFNEDFLEAAKPDAFWQMLILYGALQETSLKLKRVEYQCPTYFGMLVASYGLE